jgi:hypothetical protein
MLMKSVMLGKRTSGAEVTNVSRHGFWLLDVEWPQPHHLYWPDLDVDIAVESIRHPEKFPLISKKLRPMKRSSQSVKARR